MLKTPVRDVQTIWAWLGVFKCFRHGSDNFKSGRLLKVDGGGV